MIKKIDQPDPQLADLLAELKSVPERDPRAAARGKNKFLAEAVSLSEKRRHSGWMTIFYQNKKFAVNLIGSTLAIIGLLFTGTVTVAAAQDDLPMEALYQIKLFSEDAQLWLNTDPATEVDLLMQQAQTRTEEMAALNGMSVIPPAALGTRTQDRINQALQVTATLNEKEVTDTLLIIRERLQTQDQLLSQLKDGSCVDCEPIVARTRAMLHTQQAEVENGLNDPQGFIRRHRHQTGFATPVPTQAPVTEKPSGTATESPIVTGDPILTRMPRGCPESACTPAMNGTPQQNGNMGTPEPQGGKGKQNQDNHSNEQKKKGGKP